MTSTINTYIKFRAKAWEDGDATELFSRVPVPTLTTRHCDMHAFRIHPYFGAYANSALFPAMLAMIRTAVVGGRYVGSIRLDKLPEGVTVDTSGFLAVVTVDVDQLRGLPAHMLWRPPGMATERDSSHE